MTEEVLQAIPHRPPFLFVDKVVETREDGIVCSRVFRAEEKFYEGHYPNAPLTPGVLLCESVFQAAAIHLVKKAQAGGDAAFDKAAPFNALGLFDTHIATAGVYEGEAYTDTSEGYKKLFVKDNKLVGFILIDCIERAGIYTSLIREQTTLDTVDFELLKKTPALMAFARGTREEYLTRRR